MMHIDNLSTTYKLKEDLNKSLYKPQWANERGQELVTLKISTRLIKYKHINVRTQIESWKSQIGKSNYLLIHGKAFSADYFKLKEISVTDIQLNDEGTFLSANLDLFFEENLDPKLQKPKELSTEDIASFSSFTKGSKVRIMSNADAFYNTDMIPEKHIRIDKFFEVVSVSPSRNLVEIILDDGTTQLANKDFLSLHR